MERLREISTKGLHLIEVMQVDEVKLPMQLGEDKEGVRATESLLIIQEKDQSRIPLLDCTNNIGLTCKSDNDSGNLSMNGQWKRRARM